MNDNLVAVMPLYNHAELVGDALRNVASQTRPPDRLIVIDDASTDGGGDVVSKLTREFPVIELIGRREKSSHWVRDMIRHALDRTDGTLFHLLAADDRVTDFRFYESALANRCGAGVLVADCACVQGDVTTYNKSGMPAGRAGGETLYVQLEKPTFHEGGPCALLSREALAWLMSLDFWKMGPWSDSVGLSVAGCKFGLAYLPKVCGVVNFREGYASGVLSDVGKTVACFLEIARLLGHEEVVAAAPEPVRLALLDKVERNLPPEAAKAVKEKSEEIKRLLRRNFLEKDDDVSRSAARLYDSYLPAEDDIKEYLPYLKHLASQCGHVTELGTRDCLAAAALLAGAPKEFVTYDIDWHPRVGELELAARAERKTAFKFAGADTLTADIDHTDLLFINTWHVYHQLRTELKRYAPKVKKAIVLHGTSRYGTRGDGVGHMGLNPAVEEFLERGTFRVVKRFDKGQGLAVLERVAPEPGRPWPHYPASRVFLGIPFMAAFVGQVIDSYDNAVYPHGEDRYEKFYTGGSFHARNFNQLWTTALNTRSRVDWTDFAMIHSDVRPDGYWLSTMLYEKRKHKADLLSVVLPIKTGDGYTSTAVHNRKTGELRRLTMKEVMAVPHQTFDALGAGCPEGWELLASTGLWVCDFTKPWVEKVWFEVRDRVTKNAAGFYGTETVSEDWAFSRVLNGMGLKVMATKAVPAGHWGAMEYRNDEAWGTAEKDEHSGVPFGGWEDWPPPGT